MSELRWNRLAGEWVVTATHRQERTFLPPAEFCPLCPTKPGGFETEIDRPQYEIAVFQNRFPSLRTPPPLPAIDGNDVFAVAPAVGECEVIVYTSDHHATMGSMPIERIESLVDVWIDRTQELGKRDDVAYVFIFENRGEAMGVTLHHPHGQLYAYPFVPPVVARELAGFRAYRTEGRGCMLCDMRASDIGAGRAIDEAPATTTVIPFAARYPYEAHIVMNRHVAALPSLTGDERSGLARAIRRLVRGYDALFDRVFPYVMAVHQAPTQGDGDYHAHIEFYPPMRTAEKLKYLAGSEIGAGMFINDTLPEERAAVLRDAIRRANEPEDATP